ncbi:hypothetical protein Dsin_024232 [Dipteronia sinensis]|uniref:Uncharacterized protein n=1 Tax=Dipteronia sinensis TaxID=43782 RepID=A0AAD9ZTL1_9ROSI|nr:hypothetical protein Dsin_024232 [Dipteronia sinensis]
MVHRDDPRYHSSHIEISIESTREHHQQPPEPPTPVKNLPSHHRGHNYHRGRNPPSAPIVRESTSASASSNSTSSNSVYGSQSTKLSPGVLGLERLHGSGLDYLTGCMDKVRFVVLYDGEWNKSGGKFKYQSGKSRAISVLRETSYESLHDIISCLVNVNPIESFIK